MRVERIVLAARPLAVLFSEYGRFPRTSLAIVDGGTLVVAFSGLFMQLARTFLRLLRRFLAVAGALVVPGIVAIVLAFGFGRLAWGSFALIAFWLVVRALGPKSLVGPCAIVTLFASLLLTFIASIALLFDPPGPASPGSHPAGALGHVLVMVMALVGVLGCVVGLALLAVRRRLERREAARSPAPTTF